MRPQTGPYGNIANLHERGVLLVAARLREEGFTLESLARDEAYDPQIVAVRSGRRYHFAVRTAWWPQKPKLECEDLEEELREWATRHEAECYLVKVSLRPSSTDWLRIRFNRI